MTGPGRIAIEELPRPPVEHAYRAAGLHQVRQID
jgi:hypothetical protein